MAGSIQFKVEQGRTLVPVGEPCPFACKYCYTRGGEVGPPRIAVEEIIYHLQRFAPTCNGLQRQMAPLLICRAVIKDRRSSLRRHPRRLSGPFPVTRVARKQTYDRNFNMPSD